MWGDIGVSVLIIAIVLLIRWFVVRQIRGHDETLTPEKRKWISITRNLAVIIIIVSLILLWALEITNFALSVAAVSVALVLASKEILLCLLGGIYRTISRAFDVGDWVQIGTHAGEVLEVSLLTTQLQELTGPDDAGCDYTGRLLVIPNAMLLNHSVSNFSYTRNFNYLVFDLVTPIEQSNPDDDHSMLEQELSTIWADYADLALRYWAMIRRRSGVDLPHPAPQVTMQTTEIGHVLYRVQIYCQRTDATDIQKRITRHFLGRVSQRAMPR